MLINSEEIVGLAETFLNCKCCLRSMVHRSTTSKPACVRRQNDVLAVEFLVMLFGTVYYALRTRRTASIRSATSARRPPVPDATTCSSGERSAGYRIRAHSPSAVQKRILMSVRVPTPRRSPLSTPRCLRSAYLADKANFSPVFHLFIRSRVSLAITDEFRTASARRIR